MSAGEAPAADRRAAVVRYEAGRLAEAEATCRAVLAASPRDAATRHLLGVILARTGRMDGAAEELARAAADAPRDTGILTVLGAVLRAAGRLDEAVERYRAALAIDPRLAGAHGDLGVVLLEAGRPAEAAAALSEAVALAPDDADARTNLGLAVIETGDGVGGLHHLRRAAELAPGEPDAMRNLAAALGDFGDPGEAEAIYRGLLARTPDDAETLRALAGLYRRTRRFAEAEAAYRRAVALDAGDVEARIGIAYARDGVGDFDGAIAVCHDILTSGADLTVVHALLANLMAALGRTEEAEAHYAKAVAAQPGGGGGIRPLAGALAHVGGEAALARLRAMLEERGRAQTDIAEIHLAIGRLLDRSGQVEEAFPHFAAGNAIKSRRSGYRPDDHARLTDRIVSVFDRALFDALAPDAPQAAGPRPVFVIGMPRSGTTLVEQILASHSRVHAAGELDALEGAASAIGPRAGVPEPFPESVRALTPGTAAAAAASYRAVLQRRAPSGAAFAIDKMPTNFHFLGLAALLLPDARVIHCRRDPLDTCLSCFLTNFTEETGFARDLGHLGAYFRDYRRLMAHWGTVLSLPVLNVDYEALVADQEGVSRRMIEFLGLDWEAGCLEFHRTERPVLSASAEQVRRPIYASSIGRAGAYEPFLGPLIEALGEDRDSAEAAQALD